MTVFRRVAVLAVLAASLLGAAAAGAASTADASAAHASRHRSPRHVTRRHRRPPKGRPARSGACANAGVAATPGNLAAMRAAVLCLVNQQRGSRNLPALHEDGRLDRSAQGWSGAMVADGQFTHGSDFAARISAAGFDWSFAGENIATGFPTPSAVVAGWMASLGHCRNILDPGFSSLGIGMIARPVTGFASGPATWTEDFALPMGKSAPSGNTAPQNSCSD